MDSKIQARTWRVYYNDGNYRATFHAQDADAQINPDDVTEKINNIIKVCEDQMQELKTQLEKISPDAFDAIKIEGKTVEGYISNIKKMIESFPSAVKEYIASERIQENALTIHNQIQSEYNTEAFNMANADAQTCEGIVQEYTSTSTY